MQRVQGIGGIFFKAKDTKKLRAWYEKNLGIAPMKNSPWGADDESPVLEWRDSDDPDRKCHTVFDMFPQDTDFFEPGDVPYMLNFRVDDLDAMLAQLKAANVKVEGDIRAYSFGRFARIIDPEGTVIELWEPAPGF